MKLFDPFILPILIRNKINKVKIFFAAEEESPTIFRLLLKQEVKDGGKHCCHYYTTDVVSL